VRPHRSEATRRLTATPAESEAPGAEINRQSSKNQCLLLKKYRQVYIERFYNGEKYSPLHKLKVFFHEKRIESKKK
jgi:hypothetical protein